MRLSAAAAHAPFTVMRDGEFAGLGIIAHDTTAMLAFLDDEAYLAALLGKRNVACVVTTPALAPRLPAAWGVALAGSPRRAFFTLHNYLANETDFYGSLPPNEVAPDARIHPTAVIAPRGVRIGRRTVVEPHVTIYERTVLGDDVIVRAGVVLGVQGFEFKRLPGEVLPVAHAGGVWLHDRVEVQANSVIGRAVFGGYTEIGQDTKLDSLVQVSHNVRIGRRCLLAAAAVVLGSTTLGDDVWVGPNATVSNGLHVGDGAQVTLGAVVTRDVPAGHRVSGNFAIEHDRLIAFLRTVR